MSQSNRTPSYCGDLVFEPRRLGVRRWFSERSSPSFLSSLVFSSHVCLSVCLTLWLECLWCSRGEAGQRRGTRPFADPRGSYPNRTATSRESQRIESHFFVQPRLCLE